ncbi:MAG: TolC family protein [Mangrovibacterium sp.]
MSPFKLIILFLASSFTSFAQEKISLDEARKLALAHEANISIAEQTLQQQELQKKIAETYFLPSLAAQGGIMYQNNDINQQVNINLPPELTKIYQEILGALNIPATPINTQFPINISLNGAYLAGIQANQAIYAGGKIRAANRMAKIGVEIASENIRLQEINTIVKTDQAYFTHMAVDAKVKLAEKNLATLEALQKRAKDSYEVGYSNQNDLLKVQVMLSQAKLNAQKARNGLELTRMALCQIIGFSLDSPIQTDSSLIVNQTITTSTENIDISQRPDYLILEKQNLLAEEKIKSAKADYLPQLGVMAGYGTWGCLNINDIELNSHGLTALAMLKIPLFNWGRGSKEIQLAKLDKSMLNDSFEKNTQLMQLEMAQAQFTLNESALSISLCEENLLQATENQRVCNDNYEIGKETISNLLIAQTQHQEAETMLLDAKINFKLAEIEFLRTAALFSFENGL